MDRTQAALVVALFQLAIAFEPVLASMKRERADARRVQAFRHPDLQIGHAWLPDAQTPAATPAAGARDEQPPARERGRIDRRGGRHASLFLSEPLLPGRGKGNALAWPGAPPADRAAWERAAWRAFRDFLRDRPELGIDVAELGPPRVTVHADGELVQIHAPRRSSGLPVRDCSVSAVIRHGNLTLFGARNWGSIDVSLQPSLTAAQAAAVVGRHVAPERLAGSWREARLELVPTARGSDPRDAPPGAGYAHRIAWVLGVEVEADDGRWEALVDARSGELLSFLDERQRATPRSVVGGVYPYSNSGVPPDGDERPGWPMPFALVLDVQSNAVEETDAGGNVMRCVDGLLATTLTGSYTTIVDPCGPSLATSFGDIDFGISGGTDCTTPGVGLGGNTHASRTTFHHLNRIQELARSHLPTNPWLQQPLVANVNDSFACNADYDPMTGELSFAGIFGGFCNNLGELPGIIDHEWGHGMDHNDAVPSRSSPGEGIADIYAALRSDDSCVGLGFFQGFNCGGYGDPCVACDGVRDIDWAQRQSGVPHDLAWIDSACGSFGSSPCGGNEHCEGAVYAEAVWDLYNRDLTGAPLFWSRDRARELAMRLTFVGGGNVGSWYSCVPGMGTGDGCNADGGYLNYLSADDDNGDLMDGTPHMTAIHAAFDRHGIACAAPLVQDSGCAGTPSTPPLVSATPLDRGVELSWGAVAGASSYRVFRSDAPRGCDSGKVQVADTAATSFAERGLQNGRSYSYLVIPMGPADTCFGAASSCTNVVPTAGPNLGIDQKSASLAILNDDGDGVLEDGEDGRLHFEVFNLGNGAQTGARVVSVTPVSHPGTPIATPLPADLSPAALSACDTGAIDLDFTGTGLSASDTIVMRIELSSDQLSPLSWSEEISVSNVTAIPEPAELLLLVSGLGLLAALGRRRGRSPS